MVRSIRCHRCCWFLWLVLHHLNNQHNNVTAFTFITIPRSRGTTTKIAQTRSMSKFVHQTQRFKIKRTSAPKATVSLSAAIIVTPTLSASQIYRIGGIAGIVGLVCQIGLTKIFQQFKFTKDNAGYAAHTVVALLFMIYLSICGTVGWFSAPYPNTAVNRLLVPNDQCRFLATIVTGLLLIWDIPTSIYVPKLRKIDVLIHHVVMTITSYTAATMLPMFYVFFYFGVSEISSIPLLVHDQLCILSSKTNVTNANDSLSPVNVIESRITTSESGYNKAKLWLIHARDRVQIIAAVSFTIIRAILFTYVTISKFIPDVVSILGNVKNAVLRTNPIQLVALRYALYASIGFTSLQLFWFLKMLKQIFQQEAKSKR
jgi:hypothetical protein